jgi:hypothetical protein
MQKRKQLIETLQQRRPHDENMSTGDESQVIRDSMESTFLIFCALSVTMNLHEDFCNVLFSNKHISQLMIQTSKSSRINLSAMMWARVGFWTTIG